MPRKAADKTLSRRVLVNVSRDAVTKTPRVVWQHEIPVLEAVFGEGNVVEVDPVTLNEGYSKKASRELLPFNKEQDQILPPSETNGIGFVFIGEPAVEYERMAQVYGKHPDVNMSMVENVYGRFQSGMFKSVIGKAEVEDLPEQQLRQLAKEHGYLPVVSEKSTTEEKKAASDMQRALAVMPHEELVKLAEDLGVEV